MGCVGKMRALTIIASVVLLAIVLGLPQQPALAQDPDVGLQPNQLSPIPEAKELVRQGRYAEAETLLRRSLARTMMESTVPIIPGWRGC
jgi:hypothetical protein